MPQNQPPSVLTVDALRAFLADMPDDAIVVVNAPAATDFAELHIEFECSVNAPHVHRTSVPIDVYTA